MKELRVLELITVPMEISGLPLYPLRLAQHMPDVSVDFLTYSIADGRAAQAARSCGAQVFEAPHRLRHPVKYIRYVANIVRSQGYDVVHAHGNSCTLAIDLLAAGLGGCRVRIAHSHNSKCRFAPLHRLLRPVFDRLYTHAMSCGEEAGRWLFGKKPFTVCKNAIDTGLFTYSPENRERIRAELKLGDSLALGSVGALTEIKNHAFLLDVLALLLKNGLDCTLTLVGDGPLCEALGQKARELGIADRVRFPGVRTDVPALLSAMDVMLLPSLFEGFPTVALEWQSAGLPAILSEAVTPDCIFSDNVRRLPADVQKWVDALCSLPQADRIRTCADGRRSLAENGYDLAQAAAQMENAYQSFVQNK